jgi:alpha-galactosidase
MMAIIARANMVSPEEMAQKESWVARNFQAAPEAGLLVVTNHGTVTPNGRGDQPMRLGDKPYSRGLYCHAVSKVIVRLPSPGKAFGAVVGVDSNDQTRPGRGSVVFSMNVNGREMFKSPLMREGVAGVPVQVDLAGATSFTLEVGDGGDGISCDQSDWVDAKVTLADGKELWMGDLPFIDDEASSIAPFSFTYGGRSSSELLGDWRRKERRRRLDDNRTEHTITWTDPNSGLAVRCVAVDYRDFPTVEWTLYFKNTGRKDTEIIADIRAIDASLRHKPQGEFVLRHWLGSQASKEDYQPQETTMGPDANLSLAPNGGRGTDGVWPYFNIDWGGEGALVAVGWPGRWSASFVRDGGAKLRVCAGQELTHFKLHPGEEVRSPLIAMQFWHGGDWIRAQNIWRRWMLAHNVPRANGKLPKPFTCTCIDDAFPFMMSNAADEMRSMDEYKKHGTPLDYWWIDAGWYRADRWWNTGTWEPDPKRYPKGVREAFDHAHKLGMKTILWHEPERVTVGTWLWVKHPEWLLGTDPHTRLLNLGNREALKWVIDHFDREITEQGEDLYRQDFNMDPLICWRDGESEDRQGINENKDVTGYLAFWDALRRRHPCMIIDSCASGGRRNDLETMRRAVPLLASDYRFEPVGTQGHNYGISSWIPFHGTGVGPSTPYVMRSHFRPCYGYGGANLDRPFDYAICIRMANEWRAIADDLLGDYYPLTSYSLAENTWVAWQYDLPERGQGVVQAFRHSKSPHETARLKLRGLDPAATYELRNFDVAGATTVSGRELMEPGLLLTLTNSPDSAVISYKRVGRAEKE